MPFYVALREDLIPKPMNQDLTVHNNAFAGPSGLRLPPAIERAGEHTRSKFIEFFVGQIANDNTRAAYGRAVRDFFNWCEARQLELDDVNPVLAGAYIRWHPGSDATVKQHLAALRTLYDWKIEGVVALKHLLEAEPARAAGLARFAVEAVERERGVACRGDVDGVEPRVEDRRRQVQRGEVARAPTDERRIDLGGERSAELGLEARFEAHGLACLEGDAAGTGNGGVADRDRDGCFVGAAGDSLILKVTLGWLCQSVTGAECKHEKDE